MTRPHLTVPADSAVAFSERAVAPREMPAGVLSHRDTTRFLERFFTAPCTAFVAWRRENPYRPVLALSSSATRGPANTYESLSPPAPWLERCAERITSSSHHLLADATEFGGPLSRYGERFTRALILATLQVLADWRTFTPLYEETTGSVLTRNSPEYVALWGATFQKRADEVVAEGIQTVGQALLMLTARINARHPHDPVALLRAIRDGRAADELSTWLKFGRLAPAAAAGWRFSIDPLTDSAGGGLALSEELKRAMRPERKEYVGRKAEEREETPWIEVLSAGHGQAGSGCPVGRALGGSPTAIDTITDEIIEQTAAILAGVSVTQDAADLRSLDLIANIAWSVIDELRDLTIRGTGTGTHPGTVRFPEVAAAYPRPGWSDRNLMARAGRGSLRPTLAARLAVSDEAKGRCLGDSHAGNRYAQDVLADVVARIVAATPGGPLLSGDTPSPALSERLAAIGMLLKPRVGYPKALDIAVPDGDGRDRIVRMEFLYGEDAVIRVHDRESLGLILGIGRVSTVAPALIRAHPGATAERRIASAAAELA